MARLYASVSPEISPREEKNMARSRQIAAQTIVLLKNDGLLPLSADTAPLAVFGSGVRRTVKGGTGSGDVNSRSVYNVEQGLISAGFTIGSSAWLDRYDRACEQHMAEHMEYFMGLLQEKGQAAILEALAHPYRDPDVPEITPEDLEPLTGTTALYVIARTSGEGSDRRVEPGDYELSAGEISNLRTLTAAFAHVIVVLNVGGVIDTKLLRSEPKIGAILLMSQLGNISGLALADVLTGKVTPSGKLTATWAENYSDYPSADSFGHRNGNLADEYYSEGIFVGYRWFDSFGITPAYPFGYGLSYADFQIGDAKVSIAGGEICVRAEVTNRSSMYSGKETVQIYVSQPEGRLQKPYQVLAGFAKTGLLAPGESEEVTIRFPLTALASYDEERAEWLLEAGEYIVRAGRHSRDTHIAAILLLSEEAVTYRVQNWLRPDCMIHEPAVSRNRFYSYPEETQEKEQALKLDVISSAIPCETAKYRELPAELFTAARETVTMEMVLSGQASLADLCAQLTDEELVNLCVGTARGGFGSTSVIGAASTACPGAAGDTTSGLLESRGVPNLVLADGPAGLRLSRSFVADAQGNVIPGLGESALGGLEKVFGTAVPERPADAVDYYQYCTAIPIATALAQSWDMKLIEEAGDIVGEEMEEFGITLWLAPGMNIQRNPLCGRDFEYYSEDPLLSGLCAAADTAGVQKHPGKGTCIKHFALNNQEDNRSHNNAHASERTIREIYLRGFEIAVRCASPLSLMTSYNLLNGIHTANSHDLLTSILRDEWQFQGLVMTDWGTTGGGDLNPAMDNTYGFSDPALCIKAGNDLIMPGSQEDVDALLAALETGALTRGELQACAMRILELARLHETCEYR